MFLLLACAMATGHSEVILGKKSPNNPNITFRWKADAIALIRIDVTTRDGMRTVPIHNWGTVPSQPSKGYTLWNAQSGNVLSHELIGTMDDRPLDVGITRYELWCGRADLVTGAMVWYFDKYITVDTSGNIIGEMDLMSRDTENRYRALTDSIYTSTASESKVIQRVYEGTTNLNTILTIPPHYLEVGILAGGNFVEGQQRYLGGTFTPEDWQTDDFSKDLVAVKGRDVWQLKIGPGMVSAPETAIQANGKGDFSVLRPNELLPVGDYVIEEKYMDIFDLGRVVIDAPVGTLTEVPDIRITGSISEFYPQAIAVYTVEFQTANSPWIPIFSISDTYGTAASLLPVTSGLADVKLRDVVVGDANYRVRMFIGIPYKPEDVPVIPGTTLVSPAVIDGLTRGAVPPEPFVNGSAWLEFTADQKNFTVDAPAIKVGTKTPGGPGGPGGGPSDAAAGTITTER